MRILLLILLLPFIAVSNDTDKIDLTYSMQGENLIMTWSGSPSIAKYVIKSGTDIDDKGDVIYKTLEVIKPNGKFQITYSDNRQKPASIIYYKVIAMDKDDHVVTKNEFSANYVNKDKYTVNINPNYFSQVLDFEINTKIAGDASITIEELAGNDQVIKSKTLEKGYNSFSVEIDELKANKLVVKVDHNEKVVYRMLEVEGQSPAIITSDE